MIHDHLAEAWAWAAGSIATGFWIWVGMPIWAAMIGGLVAPFAVIAVEKVWARLP